jgi:hypothetical protein
MNDSGLTLVDYDNAMIKLDALTAEVRQLREAIAIIGAQQQYVTDTVIRLATDMPSMLGGGGPMKMLMNMMRRGTPVEVQPEEVSDDTAGQG